MWKVGRLLFWACWTTQRAVSTSHEPQATSRRLNPHPGPPPREGALLNAKRVLQVPCQLRTKPTSYELQATSHEPPATCRPYRFPGRGRPTRPRSGVHAGSNAEDWVAVNGPTAGHELQATGCRPRATGHTPALPPPRERSFVGCETRAAGARLATDEIHEPRATSHRPQVSFLPPPPGEVAEGRRGGG